MKRQKQYLLGVLITLLLSSCESNHSFRSGTGMNVTGKVGEILVVCDQALWESELKTCLDSNLTQWIMPYFPDVATFELIHKTPHHFTQGVKRWRNTLFLTIDPDYKGDKGSIVRKEDVWAKGQLLIEVTAKDFNQLVETCKQGMNDVHDEFDTFEWKRLIRQFEKSKTNVTINRIKENFGIDIVLPANSNIVWGSKNFYRIEFPAASRPIEFVGAGTEDPGTILSGMMIYQYDYLDSTQFAFEQLLRDRDTMLKYNVPHENGELYMGTQYEKIVFPEMNVATNESGTISGVDLRGMFYFTGKPIHSTGGAFWEFHFVNPKTQKMLCLSGYVDAPPTTSWTQPIREVQAVLRSVEFVK